MVPGIQSDTWAYDQIGNLTSKIDAVNSVTDNYVYDRLNRLTGISGPGIVTRTIAYDAIGNITAKSDVGAYAYPTGTNPARPHAVSTVTANTANGAGGSGAVGGVTSSYGYDANGNLTTASGTIQNRANTTAVAFSRAISYLSFNLPGQISQTQAGASYTYGPDHERIKLITQRPDDTITSLYLHPDNTGGLRYERDTKATAGTTEHKYYVNSPAGLLGVFVVTAAASGNTSQMRYYHRDHLGSITAITNEAGTKIESLAYEAFGERRNANGDLEDKTSPIIGITTDRGYTGHEHLDELNLIHMNGRIYDPVLGRFMSADPYIQDPINLQSYNRYSYCLNSPAGCTDPSGHFWQIVVAVIAAAEVAKQAGIIDSGLARTIQGIALSSLFLPGGVGNIAALGPIGNAALGGFVGGLVSGGSVESGLQGAFSAALFNVAGSIPGLNDAGRVAAHAVVGCVSASAGGGSCAQGAVSAAVGELTTIAAGEFGIKDVVARGVITAVAGGITAQASGGKFANGALTAGFGYLFNACSNGQCGASPEESGAYSGANTGADQIGASALKIGASLIPGAAAAECLGGCSAVAWGMAALDFVPGGKPAASVLRLSGFRGSLGPNSFHALDRAIERGVSPQAILDTVRNPTVRIEQGGGKTLLLTNQAAVVLDKSGQAVTIWGGAQHSQKTLELLRNATTKP